MQDGHYAYVSIGEPSPVDEVPFVGQKETVYTELRRYGAGWNAACFDPGEGVKQSIDMAVCLLDPPAGLRMAAALVEPPRRSLPYADSRHVLRTDCVQ